MSTDANPPPPPMPQPSYYTPPSTAPAASIEAPTTLGATIDMLLKQPQDLLRVLATDKGLSVSLRLLLVTAPCLLVIGLVMGMVSGGMQLWAAPVKIILGLIVAAIMCLPSLYIFASLSGLRASFSTLVGVLVAMGALTSLLLAGFAPVLWIFGQSTESLGFMGALTLLIWGIAGLFGLGLIGKSEQTYGSAGGAHLTVWTFIFLLVTLQMSTALRPILGPGEGTTFLPEKKMFFLEHWVTQMGSDPDDKASNSRSRSE